METRKDPLSGDTFVAKRITQRFKTPTNRILYWNEWAKKVRHKKSKFDKPLHRNYLIITVLLNGKKEAVFHKQFLLGKGYHFGLHTHSEGIDGKNHFAIYEFIIAPLPNDMIKFHRYE